MTVIVSLCSGYILGQCYFTDVVFCHYSHRLKEVVMIALPRVLSCVKKELRDRRVLRVSFFNPPKSLIDPQSKQNNSTLNTMPLP